MKDHAAETVALAAYLNAPRTWMDDDERELFEQDTAKAKAAVECAWLEAKVQEAPCDCQPFIEPQMIPDTTGHRCGHCGGRL